MQYLFVESTEFTRRIVRLRLESELRLLQLDLTRNPRSGRLEKGACGLRKVRMPDARRQQGKSFGARVHDFFVPHRSTIYLLNVYRKDEQSGLTAAQKKELCAKIRPLRAE